LIRSFLVKLLWRNWSYWFTDSS